MRLECPKCQQPYAGEDVNITENVAFCRHCNEGFTISALVDEKEEVVGPPSEVDLRNPPSGLWFQEDFEGFEVGATTRSPVAFFLIPFMCVWSGGSLGGIYGSQIARGQFSWFESLFGIPFLIGSVFLGGITLMTIFGKTLVRVSRTGEGTLFTGVGRIGWTRRFDWNSVRAIYQKKKRSSKGQISTVLVLQADKPIDFASGANERRQAYMLTILQHKLKHSAQSANLNDMSVSMQ